MLDIVIERICQKYRTYPYPDKAPVLPPRFRGRPVLDASLNGNIQVVEQIQDVCPTGAFGLDGQGCFLDMGRCTFCGECANNKAASGLVVFSGDWQLAASRREDLYVRPGQEGPPPVSLDAELRSLFTNSFRFRQVSAAGCNACEADLNVLTTLAFDLGRFGMEFVASPRHADALAVTGPVSRNMVLALHKVDIAMPRPRLAIAVGACAISGGLFANARNPQSANGLEPHLPVDLYIPGCPPHPYTILDGFLRLLGRV